MYAESRIHFRDPFVSGNVFFDQSSKSGWSSQRHPAFNPALTPPPDMNAASYAPKSSSSHQESDYHTSWRAPATSYNSQDLSNSDLGRNGSYSGPISRPFSPANHQRQSSVDGSSQQSLQRRGSIALSFQIPKSVNDSGGSLAELAAQITGLFWFESSELLQQIEDSVIPLQPSRPLVADAKPTTGFRKWVTTILSTTMVAQNVVILALLFIYRLKKLNPSVQGKPGSEYRLLTVALMLGNKFLDDNTYTNRTWAEVSGINVSEVHIMEVEFLSNMKYCLFTSADDWTQWQGLLGKFAAYFERASRPQPPAPPAPPAHLAPLLPPTSSLNLPMALPSPPASNQASPPYMGDLGPAYGSAGLPGPSPAPSPHVYLQNERLNARKRSYDDHSVEPPPKRMAAAYSDYQSPHSYATPQSSQMHPIPRLPLPNSTLPPYQSSNASNYATSNRQLHQLLPPLNVPARAMAMVYPSSNTSAALPQVQALVGPSQPQSQMSSQQASRQQSPYPGSGAASPTSALTHTGPILPPAIQVSPTYFLQHRNSPYRPVQNVSTLLYPPPTSALHRRVPTIDSDQMYYQPLGKPQQRQPGRLPYVMQNMWLDGSFPETMTPVQQWPSFINTQQRQQLVSQQ